MAISIQTEQLTKRFERRIGWSGRMTTTLAVDGVTLTVPEGEVFGLLGPNGAGKTTLVKMLCTLITPSSGTATVAGHPLNHPGDIRRVVGLVVSDERSFYWRLTGQRNLTFFASMYGLQGAAAQTRINRVLEDVGMSAHADKPFSNYSTGMRQRLAIARSLLHRPRILILDEPSRSLDPSATARLHRLIQELIASQGVTIFLITHDLSEAEKLCQQVAVMHEGRIQVVGNPAGLRQELRPWQRYLIRARQISPAAEEALRLLLPDLQVEIIGGITHFTFNAGEHDGLLTAAIDQMRSHQIEIHSIEGSRPSLEEVFAHYTAGT